jgi:hypothetical protein
MTWNAYDICSYLTDSRIYAVDGGGFAAAKWKYFVDSFLLRR